MLHTLGLATVAGLVAKTNAAAVYAGTQSYIGDKITVSVVVDSDKVTIQSQAPDNAWFGFGFGETTMTGYAVIVDKETDQSDWRMYERDLVDKGDAGLPIEPGTLENIEMNDIAEDNERLVKAERPRTSDDDKVYDFPLAQESMLIIVAYGTGEILGDHTVSQRTKTSFSLYDTRYSGSVDLTETSSVLVELSGDENEEVKITLCSSDTENWAAVGFCSGDTACSMDGTYALIMQGDGTRQERILGDGAQGTTIVTSDSGQTTKTENGAQCMTIIRECAPQDIDEAANLPCGVDEAFKMLENDEAMFSRKLIASLGGTAEFDGTKHTSTKSDITLEMCRYIIGEEDSRCLKATVGYPDESGDTDDSDGSASTVSTLMAFISLAVTIAYHL